MDVSTQAEQIDKNLQQERVFAQAYAMFGALAMLHRLDRPASG